ncbi:S1 family peptidase [Lolliginicoccus levis]|uniref:S1 family peptidase n=1 Tax=Lolliginicoccus levis TaxID=2919542 RepID=UPI00241EF5A4|nr:S1 family peptidase [Lolliginicoccus levis]
MRTSPLRRAGTAALAALALGMAPLTSAHAEPAPAPDAAALPSALVEALERDLGITAEEFLERSAIAQDLAAFAQDLRARFPDEFGGAWLDNGVPTIAATTSNLAEEAEEAGFAVTEVSRTETALRAELADLQRWIDALPEPLDGMFRGAVIDLTRNAVVLGLAESELGSAIDLPGLLDRAGVVLTPANDVVPGEDTIDEQPLTGGSDNPPEGAPEGQDAEQQVPGQQGVADRDLPPASTTVPPQLEVLGGDAFIAGNATSLRCSLGFNGITEDGKAVNLTAGHCNPDGPGTTGTPTRFLQGPLAGQVFGSFTETNMDKVDFAVITIDDAHQEAFSSAGIRGGGDLRITGTADPVMGMPVCKSGVTTGFSCGVVTATNLTLQIGPRTLGNAFTSSICALQGDSGGAIISGTRAVGISSASDVGDFTSCSAAIEETSIYGETPLLYATPINDVLARVPGVRLNTE